MKKGVRILLIVAAAACFAVALSYPILYRMQESSNTNSMDRLAALREAGMANEDQTESTDLATEAEPPAETQAAPAEAAAPVEGENSQKLEGDAAQEAPAGGAPGAEPEGSEAAQGANAGEPQAASADGVEGQEQKASQPQAASAGQAGGQEKISSQSQVASVSEVAGQEQQANQPQAANADEAEQTSDEPQVASVSDAGQASDEPQVASVSDAAQASDEPQAASVNDAEQTSNEPQAAGADDAERAEGAADAEDAQEEVEQSEAVPPEGSALAHQILTNLADRLMAADEAGEGAETPEPTVTPEPSPTPNRRERSGVLPYPEKEKVEFDESKMLARYKEIYELNDDLIGWITIPGTDVDYPVVQSEDAPYYLEHDFYGEENINGQIILDPLCDPYTPSYNLVISGHNMRSGSMFGNLDDYTSKSYWNSHKFVEFDTLMNERQYVIFAAFYSADYDVDEEGFRYNADIQYRVDADKWLKEIRDNQVYDTGIDVEFGDEFLTLTTCNHARRKDGRFVLVCRRIREGETFE